MDQNGIEFVESIEYGRNLSNNHQHMVNPFYIFDILNDEGKAFFKEYYKAAITAHIQKLEEQAKKAMDELNQTKAFWDAMI